MGKSQKRRAKAKARGARQLSGEGSGRRVGGLQEWVAGNRQLSPAEMHKAACEFGYGALKVKVTERAKLRDTIIDAHGEIMRVIGADDGRE